MKRAIKVTLIGLGSLVGLVLLLAIVLPLAFKPQVLRFVQSQLNARLQAKVSFEDLHISLLRRFPRLYVSLDKAVVMGPEPFTQDTLAALDRLAVEVNLRSLFHLDNIEVHSILLDHPYAHAQKNALGQVNWAIVKPTDATAQEQTQPQNDTASSHIGLNLQELRIVKACLRYQDDSTGIDASARDLDFLLSGKLNAARSILKMALDVPQANFKSGGVQWAKDVALHFGAKVDADLAQMRFVLQDNELKLNDFGLQFAGQVGLPKDSVVTDLTFQTTKTDFKTLLSLVPALYKRGLADVQTGGVLQLAGWVKGVMHEQEMPNAQLKLMIDKAFLQFPALPKRVEQIGVDLLVDYDGKDLDRSVVNLRRLAASMGANHLTLQAKATQLKRDLTLAAHADAKVELGELKEALPLDSMELQGKLALQANLAASKSLVDAKRYEECRLEGTVDLTQVVLKKVLALPVHVEKLHLTLSPKQVEVNQLQAQAGRSDVKLQGGLRDFLPYLLSQGTVKGTLAMQAHRVDLNELFPATKASAPASDAAAQKPASDTSATTSKDNLAAARRIDFTFNAGIDSLYFQNIAASNVKGAFRLASGKLWLEQVAAQAMGGRMDVRGELNFQDTAAYPMDVTAQLHHVELKQVVTTFTTLAKSFPILEHLQGDVSLSLGAKGALSSSFTPDLMSLNADGTLSTNALSIVGSPTFQKLGAVLQNDMLAHPTLEDFKLPFSMRNGVLSSERFTTSLKGIDAGMEGSVSLEQDVDYKMDLHVPTALLGKASDLMQQGLSKLIPGTQLPAKLPVIVHVTGKVTDPKVSVSLGQDMVASAKQLVQQKVEEVKQQAKETVNKALEEAQAKAAQLRAEAQAKADALLAEAQKKADELVEAAKAKGPLAAAAAKLAADRVLKEAQAQVQQILDKANSEADGLINQAKQQ